jgi:O-antigen/teichoic acid export membrane protein
VLLLLVVGLPAALGLVLLAPNMVRVMLGAPFREAATALVPWIAVATLIASLRFHYLDLAFHLGKRTLRQMAIMAIAGLTNLLLNLWWIPLFGMLGAAYATLVTYVLAFVLAWWLGRGSFPLPAPPPAQLLRISVAVVGMGLALWPLRDLDGPVQLLLQVAIGIVVYAACLLALDVAGSRGRVRAIVATAHRTLRRPASS